jgi:hypothetical protein
MQEIVMITRGATQDESQFFQTKAAIAGTPFDNPVMAGLMRLLPPSVAQIAGHMAGNAGIRTGEPASERMARERREAGMANLAQIGAVPTPFGFIPLQAREAQAETGQPALDIPSLPTALPWGATGTMAALTNAALLKGQQDTKARAIRGREPSARPDVAARDPLGRRVATQPSVPRVQIKTPNIPPPPTYEPPVPTIPGSPQEAERRRRAAQAQGGGARRLPGGTVIS